MISIRRTFISWRVVCAIAIVAGTAAGARGATATWDRNSEPDVVGYRLSYGTQSGIHTVTIDVGNVTSYVFNPPAGMRYYVVVQAYNASGVLSDKSSEVLFDLSNRAPTLVQPANQTSMLNASVAIALSASDPEGRSLSFSASGLPPGVTVHGASAILSGLALAKGNYLVTVKASDGALSDSKQFTWTVADAVSAPIVVDVRPLDTTLYLSYASLSAIDALWAYVWPANRVAAAILMKFNLSAIPANATIQSAVLGLTLKEADANAADPNHTMSLHQVLGRNPDVARASGMLSDGTTGWTANQCCSGGVPLAQADISAARSRTAVNREYGLKLFDVTAVARAWLAAPATNYGLLLNPDTSKADGYRIFGSMEDPIQARRPFLRVTYTMPVSVAVTGGTTSSPAGDTPFTRVTGDFDGDGVGDLTTYRAGEWRIWTSRSSFATMVLANWGGIGDVPVAGDYDGDKVTDVGVYQPLSGSWQVWLSNKQQPLVLTWGGVTNDQPSAVDADGDGKADPTILRDGAYWILLSSANFSTGVTKR